MLIEALLTMNYKNTIRLYKTTPKQININPNFAPAYNNRGNAYYGLQEYYKAIQDYTKAININPNYASAYYNRGTTYDELQEYYKAIQDYTKAININPNYADAYYNRSIAHYLAGYREKKL